MLAQIQLNQENLAAQLSRIETRVETVAVDNKTQCQHVKDALAAQTRSFSKSWQAQQTEVQQQIQRIELQYSSLFKVRFDKMEESLKHQSTVYSDMQQELLAQVQDTVQQQLNAFFEKISCGLDSSTETITRSPLNQSIRVVEQMNAIESSLDRSEAYWELNQQSTANLQQQNEAIQAQLESIQAHFLHRVPLQDDECGSNSRTDKT